MCVCSARAWCSFERASIAFNTVSVASLSRQLNYILGGPSQRDEDEDLAKQLAAMSKQVARLVDALEDDIDVLD